MKISYDNMNREVVLVTETAEDHYLLGKLHGKLREDCRVYPHQNNQMEMSVLMVNLLLAASK